MCSTGKSADGVDTGYGVQDRRGAIEGVFLQFRNILDEVGERVDVRLGQVDMVFRLVGHRRVVGKKCSSMS